MLLVVRYGPGSDWVRNILEVGTATIRVDGGEHRLESRRLVSRQAVDELASGFDPGPAFFKAEHYLLMDQDVVLGNCLPRSFRDNPRG